jgi:hypothetical protein
MKSIADILAETRAYLEEHGWLRGHLQEYPEGRVCGMGALVISQGWWNEEDEEVDSAYACEVERVLGKVAAALGLQNYNSAEFVRWNDDEAADQQAVLDAFAKAEKIERAGFDPDEGVKVE